MQESEASETRKNCGIINNHFMYRPISTLNVGKSAPLITNVKSMASEGSIDLKCLDCKRDFFFSKKEQEKYTKEGWQQPKRCYECRIKKRAERQAQAGTPQ